MAREAGVARTTVYRRYRDKADLVSAAIETLRPPVKRSGTADARLDLIAHLEAVRRNYGISLAGTLLMEEPYNPRLLQLFRERMVLPQRRIVAETIAAVWPLIEAKAVRPVIDRTLTLDDVVEAHELVESSEHIGKVLMRVS